MKLAISLFAALTLVSSAQIQLKWEYRPDPETILGPNPQPGSGPSEFVIREQLTSPSGYVLLALQGRWQYTMPLAEKLVLLDPQGNATWISEDLPTLVGAPSSYPTTSSIKLMHAGPDAATVFVSSGGMSDSPSVLLIYNKNASPQVNHHQLSSEDLDTYGMPSSSLTAGFNDTTFYTLVVDSDGIMPGMGRNVAIRKYGLTVSPQPEIVIPSESGVEDRNLILRWQGASGIRYQVQQSTSLSDWSDLGQPIDGNGSTLSWSQAISAPAKFFRIVQR